MAAASSSAPSSKRSLDVDDSGADANKHDTKRSASSVGEAAAEAAQPATRLEYRFWRTDACSYTLDELRAIVSTMFTVAVERTTEYHTTETMTHTPHGAEYRIVYCRDTPVDARVDNEVNWIWQHVCVADKSRTLGHRECPLAAGEPYEEPYLLNVNNRSYSHKYIVEAIEKSLKQGKSLRLEDCTIHFSQLPSVRLYPNHGLGGWPFERFTHTEPIVYSESDVHVVPRFNEALASANSFAEASALLDGVTDEQDSRQVPDAVLARFGQSRRAAHYTDPLLENLVLERIVWPRSHIKGVVFSNVEFVDCVINHNCFCGMSFFGCRFTRCFIIKCEHNEGRWRACDFDDCTWFYPAEYRDGRSRLSATTHRGVTFETVVGTGADISNAETGERIPHARRFVFDAQLPLHLGGPRNCRAATGAPLGTAEVQRRLMVATGMREPTPEELAFYRPFRRYRECTSEWISIA
jgi:hypothetical protein